MSRKTAAVQYPDRSASTLYQFRTLEVARISAQISQAMMVSRFNPAPLSLPRSPAPKIRCKTRGCHDFSEPDLLSRPYICLFLREINSPTGGDGDVFEVLGRCTLMNRVGAA